MTAAGELRIRARARVSGVVQGVGFRPFVYRLAIAEGLGGYVLNDPHGVVLEVEGPAAGVERFMARLRAEAPPLAAIDRVIREEVTAAGELAFRILGSSGEAAPDTLVAADSATCTDCLAELRDPADRRYRYPFINCTNCGPRLTIVRGVPYDRPLTTMAGFPMCAQCRREYEDPRDRRFHAQPNACPACGPRARLLDADGARETPRRGARDPVAAAAQALAQGAILAVKGLGGYHLACDARNSAAVSALRARKHREDKPFALMVQDVEGARLLVELGEAELVLLDSPARPIVLAPRRTDSGVADAVAPGAAELGVMLPYTPLHHLLLADLPPGAALVMTSGNVSDEPIAYRDDDALARLAPIADLFLVHDRPIETRTDDSVIRVIRCRGERLPLMLRRSRGYVPGRLALPIPAARPLLACGAEQKNTFCVARGERAWVSHHIGDLEHVATLEAFREGIAHFQELFAVAPEVVAHDLHPGYLSTEYARGLDGVELLGVQHHHAHLAACLAEHGEWGAAVGAIFDGTGFGTDGTVWGGELLVGDLAGFERAGAVRPVPLPGGAAAIRQPWRMAFTWLTDAFGEAGEPPVTLAPAVSPAVWKAMAGIAHSPEVSPVTTSMGRLFDAVGALCGLRAAVSYEGQAAVELEYAAARADERREYAVSVAGDAGWLTLDPRAMIRAIAADVRGGVGAEAIAAGFHRAVALATVQACRELCSVRGLGTVVLSGGVFQNRLLLESVAGELAAGGLRVLVPERLPPGDGGIAFGQAAVLAARDAASGR